MKHKWIFAFIGGLALGGSVGTYAGAKMMYKRSHEAMVKVEEELNNLLFSLKENEKKFEDETEAVPEEKESIVTASGTTVSKTSTYYVPAFGSDDVTTAPVYTTLTEHTPAFKSSIVYTIPFDDFETEPDFESEVLFYYPESGDVTDDQHVPIAKAKLTEMIGRDALTHFDEYEEDPDCVRVKNDTMKTYFEILRYYTSP